MEHKTELKSTHHLFSSFSSLSNPALYSLSHPQPVLEILKPLAIYSSFLTTLSSQPSVYEAAAENENIFTALDLSSWLFIRKKIQNCLRSQDEKKKQGNKKRKQIVSLPSLALSWWSVISLASRSHTLMRKRKRREGRWGGGEKKTFWCFSYLTFPFYLPHFHALDRGVLLRGDEALRVFNGFFRFEEAEEFIMRE